MLPEASNAAGWENTHQVPARCPSVWHRATAQGEEICSSWCAHYRKEEKFPSQA